MDKIKKIIEQNEEILKTLEEKTKWILSRKISKCIDDLKINNQKIKNEFKK